jgi:anti-anti-sigma regulatory factor
VKKLKPAICFLSETFIPSEKESIIVAHFSGAIINNSIPTLENCFELLLKNETMRPWIILNFDKVSTFDLYGAEFLASLIQKLRAKFRQIRICQIDTMLGEILVKNNKLFVNEIKKDINEAIVSFGIKSDQIA